MKLYHEQHGDGAPLVLLHGSLGTIDSCFAGLLPELAKKFAVVAVELQGHGRTPDIERPLRYEAMASDIAELMDDLGLGSSHVVGYSTGGVVGLQLALDRPELVDRLVFAGGPSFESAGLQPELLAAFDDFDPHSLDGTHWHEAYRRVAPAPDAWPALVAKVNELDRAGLAWPAERISSLSVPTMLIAGDADIVRLEHVIEFFRLLGGGVAGDIVGLPTNRLAILPGSTHVGLLDRIDWLSSMIGEFLDE